MNRMIRNKVHADPEFILVHAEQVAARDLVLAEHLSVAVQLDSCHPPDHVLHVPRLQRLPTHTMAYNSTQSPSFK
jgi:hypothetical protein